MSNTKVVKIQRGTSGDLDLGIKVGGHSKVNLKIFNENPYFSLNILVVYFEKPSRDLQTIARSNQ